MASNSVSMVQRIITLASANQNVAVVPFNGDRLSLGIFVMTAGATVYMNYGLPATTSNLSLGANSTLGYGRTYGTGDGVPFQAINLMTNTANTVVIIEEGS